MESRIDVLRAIEAHGYEAYFVGGCVRDWVMGRSVGDLDVATSAPEGVLQKIFPQGVALHKFLGTISLPAEEGMLPVEITPYRKEGRYDDHRRPSAVTPASSVQEDVARRDFTVNGLLWHPDRGLMDLVGGLDDLHRKRIRAIGRPEARFREDALRMLRALRFATVLNFSIEVDTMRAITFEAPSIRRLSWERIRDEWEKILLSDDVQRGLFLARETGILNEILPEITATYDYDQGNPHHDLDLFRHICAVSSAVPQRIVLRWAALLHDIAKPDTRTTGSDGVAHYYGHDVLGARRAEDILRRFRVSNAVRREVVQLISGHMRADPHIGIKGVRKLCRDFGPEGFQNWCALIRADALASRKKDTSTIDKITLIYHNIRSANQPLSLRDLAINGNDLLEIKMAQGPEIGAMLRRLWEEVGEGLPNERDALLTRARSLQGEL